MTFRQFAYRNVMRNKRTYAAYFFSSAFSVMIFFVFAQFIFHPDIQKGVTNLVAVQLMIAAEVIMYFFAFFFVLYSVGSFLKTRKREFGILMMHGMTRRQLNLLVFLENMLIGTGAMLFGILFGMITGKLFFMIGSKMLDVKAISFHLSWGALGLTIIAFFLLFLFISMFTTFLVRTNKLLDLFQSGQRPKKEPKVSIWLSLLSAVLLITSYYLAATTTMMTLIYRILPVILMTIIGTYFFFTQLSVFIVRRLQKNRLWFWKKTNIVTLSSLSYRLKDNARMFFMVTIVSTVAFCAVGTLASMNVINKQFEVDYPAAISYVAKDKDPIHGEHLAEIQHGLKQKGIPYHSNHFPIKYVEITSAADSHAASIIPLISFSDYKKIVQYSGSTFKEKPLDGKKVLGMTTHRFENDGQDATYTLKQNDLSLRQKAFTEHVVIPRELVGNEGLVVSDELFAHIKGTKTNQFTGFFIKDFVKTNGMFKDLVDNGHIWYDEDQNYAMAVSGTLLKVQKSLFSMMLFIALMVGAVFFIAAGSFLYFRLYADLDYDLHQYEIIMKVGLTDKELSQIVTRQLMLLFFVPILVAIIHSAFAFMALQSYFTLSIASDMIVVLVSFFVAQVLYFLVIRNRYLHKLKRALI